MSKKGWLYVGFFTFLVLAFYFVLTALIPDFGKKKGKSISYVRPFSFTSQDSKLFTEKDIAGKVCVVEFFFTTCKGICPMMNNNMRKVYDKFKDQKDVLIISHTSDPEIDSPARLKWYADSMGVSSSRWIFLTGSKDSLYTMARVSYAIDDAKNPLQDINSDFIHSQLWALVDKNGDVRGTYDGLKEEEINDLMKDIKKLLQE